MSETFQVGQRVLVEGTVYRLHDNGRTATVEFTRREGDSMAAIVPLESVHSAEKSKDDSLVLGTAETIADVDRQYRLLTEQHYSP